ncbi:MAG: 50S ribosomal protein L4 [Thioalkalivibrionaceae bacterium]
MQVQIIGSSGSADLSERCFGAEFNEDLVHQAVVAYLAGGRSGTRAQKGRTDVSGGGIKPFRQKGSGRARAGTIRSPLWRGGGKVFAASTRDFSQKLNRKMYRGALRSVLSELVRQDRLKVAERVEVMSGRTKDGLAWLESSGLSGRIVLVSDAFSAETIRAFGNVPGVSMVDSFGVNPALLVGADVVVVDRDAVMRLEGWLA